MCGDKAGVGSLELGNVQNVNESFIVKMRVEAGDAAAPGLRVPAGAGACRPRSLQGHREASRRGDAAAAVASDAGAGGHGQGGQGLVAGCAARGPGAGQAVAF